MLISGFKGLTINYFTFSFSLLVLPRRFKTEEPASRTSNTTLSIVFVKKVSSENIARKVMRMHVT